MFVDKGIKQITVLTADNYQNGLPDTINSTWVEIFYSEAEIPKYGYVYLSRPVLLFGLAIRSETISGLNMFNVRLFGNQSKCLVTNYTH